MPMAQILMLRHSRKDTTISDYMEGHPNPPPKKAHARYRGGGDSETWPEFRRRHPEMSPTEALAAFRAKKRGKNLNGDFSMGGMH